MTEELLKYIIQQKLKAAIFQAFLESKKEIDFVSIGELAEVNADSLVRLFKEHSNIFEKKTKIKNPSF